MQFLKKNMTVIGVLVIAAAAFYMYYAYFSGGQAPLLSQDAASPASQSLLLTLSDLQSITLNPAIFSDPVFESLTDFGVTIPPEAAGRPDPFAPVGSSVAAASSTAQ